MFGGCFCSLSVATFLPMTSLGTCVLDMSIVKGLTTAAVCIPRQLASQLYDTLLSQRTLTCRSMSRAGLARSLLAPVSTSWSSARLTAPMTWAGTPPPAASSSS